MPRCLQLLTLCLRIVDVLLFEMLVSYLLIVMNAYESFGTAENEGQVLNVLMCDILLLTLPILYCMRIWIEEQEFMD